MEGTEIKNKICSHCKQSKILKEFSEDKSQKDGYALTCKTSVKQ